MSSCQLENDFRSEKKKKKNEKYKANEYTRTHMNKSNEKQKFQELLKKKKSK